MIIIRLFYIIFLFIRHNCFFVFGFVPHKLLYPFKFIYNPNSAKQAHRFASFLQDGGPTFIKLGQLLATRVDLFSDIFIEKLNQLKDNVKPINIDVNKIFYTDLGISTGEAFLDFENKPCASASVAQVYKTQLKNGNFVALKVIKPGVHRLLQRDIALLSCLLHSSEFLSTAIKIGKPTKIIDTLRDITKLELNLNHEAASLDKTRVNLKEEKCMHLPKIYWEYVSQNILVEEWIDGFSIGNSAKIIEYNIDTVALSENILRVFFLLSLRDGFFHGDIHDGNILIMPNGKICLLDFGIMGILSEELRFYVKDLFKAFVERDYDKAAAIHLKLGWISSNDKVGDFALACRVIMEKVVNKPQAEIKIGKLLQNLLIITKEFGMETQEDIFLLQKNLIYVENISRTLNPNGNVWMLAEKILKKKNFLDDGKRILEKTLIEKKSIIVKVQEYAGSYFTLQRNCMNYTRKIYKLNLLFVMVIVLGLFYLLYNK